MKNSTPSEGFHFKQFQLEDYARAALHDGLILAHDTGLGKTIALFIWPALKTGFQTLFGPGEIRCLKPLAPVLLVAPGDLHDQIIADGVEKFHVTVTRLDCHATFLRLSTPNPHTGKRELPPGYYLTSYTQLTGNGVQAYPKFQMDNIVGMMQILGLTDADSGEYFDEREELCQRHYKRLGALPTMTLRELEYACVQRQRDHAGNDAIQMELKNSFDVLATFHCDIANPAFTDLPPEKKAVVRKQMTIAKYQEYADSIGQGEWYGPKTGRFKVKCVWDPSLADLCQDTFAACAVDEGVKMKGEDTVVGTGVRQINARYKLVLTATPIKNRLPDVFRLAWWATGGRPEAHARFPYPDETAARTEFSEKFLVSERNLTKEREKPARYKKLTPQVCNIHLLWKMFAPIILRRRKADAGEDIVAKIRQVVRAPLGREQAAVYKFHLDARYIDKNGGPAIGAQLQALRVAAANPASELLVRPELDFATPGDPRSKNTYIPKLHSALKLILQCLERGEQVLVFGAFNDSLDVLAARLTEAGVSFCMADGRSSPKRRGQLSAQFKLGPGKSQYQVMLAGADSMAEGHSYPLCPNVILLSYSWAWDKFEQAINRVHRLNSRWTVRVWSLICERSIDRKLEANIQEKGDAAELVLDGHLLGEATEEVNLAELLDIARKEFGDGKTIVTVDEKELEKEWPPLRAAINAAARNWRLKGLELLGIQRPTPVIELPEVTESVGTTGAPPVHEPASGEPSRPTPRAPHLAPVLELQAEEISMFDDLPLFDLAETA